MALDARSDHGGTVSNRMRCALLITMIALSNFGLRAAVPGDPVASCERLDGQSRAALQFLLEEYFPPPDTLRCGTVSYGAEFDALRRHRDEVVPCLIAIQRGHLRRTKLWHRYDPAPDVRRWATGVIGQIDPILGIRLYGAEAAAATSQWDRLELGVRMLGLGDAGSALAIVRILSDIDPATIRPRDRETQTEMRMLSAIEPLVRRDDTAALPVLRNLLAAVGSDREYLGVWVAQLERDVPALERYARESVGSNWSFALDSLARIGAREVLERIAADPKVHGRQSARMLLDKGVPPLPRPVDAASPCARLDGLARRQVAEWILFRFPPPSYAGSDCGTQSLFRPGPQADVAAACLVDIYRRGLDGTGLWNQETPAPFPGVMVLHLLGQFDPSGASQLWREWRNAPGRTQWEQARADVTRLQLGDRDAVGDIVTFLRQSPDSWGDNRGGLGYVVTEAAAALIQVDHRPALNLLNRWRDQGFLPNDGFAIGLARLGRNAPALEKLARESQQASAAVQALGFIGARDQLQRLANDSEYKYRHWAMNELERLR